MCNFNERMFSGAIAEDAVKISVMYFSGEPLVSSVIQFNDYESDAKRLQQLALERIQLINEGNKFFFFFKKR